MAGRGRRSGPGRRPRASTWPTAPLRPKCCRPSSTCRPLSPVMLPELAARRGLELRAERIDAAPDPARLFESLYGRSANAVWLDSSLPPDEGAAAERSRFSILADDGGPFGQSVRHSCGQHPGDGRQRRCPDRGAVLPLARRRLGPPRRPRPRGLPLRVHPGLARLPRLRTQTRDRRQRRHRRIPRRLPAVRRARRGAGPCGADGLAAGAGHPRRRGLAARPPATAVTGQPAPASTPCRRRWRGAAGCPALPRTSPHGTRRSPTSPKSREAQYQIAEGNTYEVCLTTALTAELPACALDPRQAYLALRRRNPAPFASYLRFGDLTVASTSPERFLRIAADGRMRAEPIKGTRHRDADPARDAQLRQELEILPEGPGREHHDR